MEDSDIITFDSATRELTFDYQDEVNFFTKKGLKTFRVTAAYQTFQSSFLDFTLDAKDPCEEAIITDNGPVVDDFIYSVWSGPQTKLFEN